MLLPASGRSLSTVLAAAGITNPHAHAALGDAEATAELLRHYLRLDRGTVDTFLREIRPVELPVAELGARRGAVLCPRAGNMSGSAPTGDGMWLNQLASGVPLAGRENVDEYLDMLGVAMLDRELSVHEVRQLTDCANDLGIGRDEALELHAGFIRQLVVLACADGVVTGEGRDDIIRVATALGVPAEEAVRLLDATVLSNGVTVGELGCTNASRNFEVPASVDGEAILPLLNNGWSSTEAKIDSSPTGVVPARSSGASTTMCCTTGIRLLASA